MKEDAGASPVGEKDLRGTACRRALNPAWLKNIARGVSGMSLVGAADTAGGSEQWRLCLGWGCQVVGRRRGGTLSGEGMSLGLTQVKA